MQRQTSDFRTRYDRMPGPIGKRVDGFHLWFAFIGVLMAIGVVTAIVQASDPSWTHQGGVAIWTDPKTGCRYTQGEAGMQPLIGPDGRPHCEGRP